jgi:hypothetical protein
MSEPPSEPSPPSGPGDAPGPGRIPPEYAALARRLRAAEDRLFPLAMVDTDRYQRAVRLVGLLARHLTETCASLDELDAAETEIRFRLGVLAATEGIPLDGLDTDLVIDAALSQRFRTLLMEQATELRRQRIEGARAAGHAWAVLEAPDAASWGGGSARWVETHVATGTLLVRSVSADPSTGTATYRIEVFGAGEMAESAPGMRVEEFTDRDAWLAAIDQLRATLESES